MFTLRHVPALDGLRAIAVLFVMLLHAGVPLFKGGAVGVDIFFVLSGFLITALLLNEWDTYGSVSLRNFYLRRILRLFPALLLLLVGVNLLALLTRDADKIAHTLTASAYALFYLSDYAYALHWTERLYLGHTWSLAVEEQFYLLFPAALLLLLSYFNRVNTLRMVFACALLSWLWRVLLIAGGASSDRVYFAFDTRLDELLIGCALALAFSVSSPRRLPSVWGVCGLLTLGIMAVISDTDAPLTLVALMPLAALTSALVIWHLVTNSEGFLVRFLSLRPIAYLGRISYGLYLWHLVIYRVLINTVRLPLLAVVVVGTLATITVASVSYIFIERPALKLKARFQAGGSPSTKNRSARLI